MPTEKAESIDDLSEEAEDCRIGGHIWLSERQVPAYGYTGEDGMPRANRHFDCQRGHCKVSKDVHYLRFAHALPVEKVVMDYKEADKYLMTKGHGRVDRSELRHRLTTIIEPETTPAKKRATPARTRATAKKSATPRKTATAKKALVRR